SVEAAPRAPVVRKAEPAATCDGTNAPSEQRKLPSVVVIATWPFVASTVESSGMWVSAVSGRHGLPPGGVEHAVPCGSATLALWPARVATGGIVSSGHVAV